MRVNYNIHVCVMYSMHLLQEFNNYINKNIQLTQ